MFEAPNLSKFDVISPDAKFSLESEEAFLEKEGFSNFEVHPIELEPRIFYPKDETEFNSGDGPAWGNLTEHNLQYQTLCQLVNA